MEAVAFSSNMATLVVSAGLDSRLSVWDTATFDSRSTCAHPQVGYSSCGTAVICTPEVLHLRVWGCSGRVLCDPVQLQQVKAGPVVPTLTVPAQRCRTGQERDCDRNAMCRVLWQWHAIHLHHSSSQAAWMACCGSGICARVRYAAADIHALRPSLALVHTRIAVVICCNSNCHPCRRCPGQCTASRTGHSEGIQCLALSPDGQFTITGSDDGTARIFSVPTPQL